MERVSSDHLTFSLSCAEETALLGGRRVGEVEWKETCGKIQSSRSIRAAEMIAERWTVMSIKTGARGSAAG